MNRDMMAQISRMQEQMQKAQAEIEARVAEASAGGGAVTVAIGGDYVVKSVKIDPDAVDPDDVSMLEDLILAATNEALQQVQGFQANKMAGLTAGLDLGSLGLGGPAGGSAAPPTNRAARRGKK
jgi:DNA-binding YbaB/EbfC family protein